MRVQLRNGYTQDYAQIMQHTHMHNAVTGGVEAKKLLSHRRQSNYSKLMLETSIFPLDPLFQQCIKNAHLSKTNTVNINIFTCINVPAVPPF